MAQPPTSGRFGYSVSTFLFGRRSLDRAVFKTCPRLTASGCRRSSRRSGPRTVSWRRASCRPSLSSETLSPPPGSCPICRPGSHGPRWHRAPGHTGHRAPDTGHRAPGTGTPEPRKWGGSRTTWSTNVSAPRPVAMRLFLAYVRACTCVVLPCGQFASQDSRLLARTISLLPLSLGMRVPSPPSPRRRTLDPEPRGPTFAHASEVWLGEGATNILRRGTRWLLGLSFLLPVARLPKSLGAPPSDGASVQRAAEVYRGGALGRAFRVAWPPGVHLRVARLWGGSPVSPFL